MSVAVDMENIEEAKGVDPVVELALSAQFDLLGSLNSGHYGIFWSSLRNEWPFVTEGNIIPDQFERFGAQSDRPELPVFQIDSFRRPNRFTITRFDKSRMIQVQPTRVVYNWIRTGGQVYPGFDKIFAEFCETLRSFVDLLSECGVESPCFNQWEIAYVDAFGRSDWDSFNDWSSIIPGLFIRVDKIVSDKFSMDHRSAQWAMEIKEGKGRLHITAHPGYNNVSEPDSLVLNMTARGPVNRKDQQSIEEGVKLGHSSIRACFETIVSPAVKQRMRSST